MKELKFRVWDGLKMYYFDRPPHYLSLTDGSWGVYDMAHNLIVGSDTHKGAQLLEFSGLRDKKGDPIFEGDIVEDGLTGRRYTMQFEDHGFWCIDKHGERYMLAQDYREIAGNIYEHSDGKFYGPIQTGK
jgi:hypothetical protein